MMFEGLEGAFFKGSDDHWHFYAAWEAGSPTPIKLDKRFDWFVIRNHKYKEIPAK